jgi:hypothetical protein
VEEEVSNDKKRQRNSKHAGKELDAYKGVIKWFKTLPLWLDLGDLRVLNCIEN